MSTQNNNIEQIKDLALELGQYKEECKQLQKQLLRYNQ